LPVCGSARLFKKPDVKWDCLANKLIQVQPESYVHLALFRQQLFLGS
jgi:hypothetical protein